ncbi:amidase [[Mycobacterium] burgundiense]|uniref:amidase n=1 Tax=[Mycobacterium] burgundiense TaxID=3064286 RepID=A0ABN9NHI6_9MYCO|nr:amidase [Mycolicibacterium sp. MU0053]CAJ1506451.1 amidase [Mycolicibacterium sp. MU0053]
MAHMQVFGDDALGELDAVAVAEAIEAGTISRSEAIEAAIDRTARVDPALNALAGESFDRARARANRPYGGFFDGVPSAIKDNSDVAGLPTMKGSDAWRPFPVAADGDFTRLFFATGLNIVGKTQMSEFGFSASAEHPRLGPVRNPWHPQHTAGASSSGSAVLVATGAVPIAHANDGGGSIRIPAACTGLVGLKPSRGRLPLEAEHAEMPIKIVANGVLTRSVRDTAAFYREAERAWRNRRLPAIGDVTGPAHQRLRIAVVTRSIRRDSAPEVREATLKAAALLETLGHHVEPLEELPVRPSFVDDFVLYWALLSMALVRGGRKRFGASFDRTRLDNLSLGLDRHAARNLHRIPTAIARLATTRRSLAAVHRRFDVVLTPTLAHETPPIGALDPMADYEQVIDRLIDWVAFTPLHNITGDPAISLPLAQSSTGLPIGMMFSAPLGQDARLLELAFELEAAAPFARIQDS